MNAMRSAMVAVEAVEPRLEEVELQQLEAVLPGAVARAEAPREARTL